MKWMLLLLLATGAATTAFSATTNVTFTWDSPSIQPTGAAWGYKFYEKSPAGNRTLLGGTSNTNRFFTVTNWVIGQSRTFTVTTTNMWEESLEGTPFVAPVLEPPPANVRPVPFSFVVPVPGVIELSEDLEDWRERFRLQWANATGAGVELVQLADRPMLFGRIRPPYVPAPLPPLPTQ